MQINYHFSFSNYRLPDGNTLLALESKDTNSVVSTGSSWDAMPFTLALAWGYFKLSLEECIEFTIFGLKIIVVHGLLSFHHREKLGHRLRQRLQQQQ
jgi:hypothetical protein